jgi:hypothetical protein
MKHIIPLELVELEENNYHLVVSSRFQDGSERFWVIDSGASKTVFDHSLNRYYQLIPADKEQPVRSAGIGSDQLDMALGLLNPFYIGDWLLPPMKTALIDLSHINALYLEATDKEICGLIGSDFLQEYRAVLDYGKHCLTLFTRKRKREEPQNFYPLF